MLTDTDNTTRVSTRSGVAILRVLLGITFLSALFLGSGVLGEGSAQAFAALVYIVLPLGSGPAPASRSSPSTDRRRQHLVAGPALIV